MVSFRNLARKISKGYKVTGRTLSRGADFVKKNTVETTKMLKQDIKGAKRHVRTSGQGIKRAMKKEKKIGCVLFDSY